VDSGQNLDCRKHTDAALPGRESEMGLAISGRRNIGEHLFLGGAVIAGID
jgi:hypothetical protein